MSQKVMIYLFKVKTKIRTLILLRDTLLSRLMSGEVRVKI
jgi:hypothetical protein